MLGSSSFLIWLLAFAVLETRAFKITNPVPSTVWNIDVNQTVTWTLDPGDDAFGFAGISMFNKKTNGNGGFGIVQPIPVTTLNGSYSSSVLMGTFESFNLFTDQWNLTALFRHNTTQSVVNVGLISLFSDIYTGKPSLGPFPTPMRLDQNSNLTTTHRSLNAAKLTLSVALPIVILLLVAVATELAWKYHERTSPSALRDSSIEGGQHAKQITHENLREKSRTERYTAAINIAMSLMSIYWIMTPLDMLLLLGGRVALLCSCLAS
jgi:hypothetical protein